MRYERNTLCTQLLFAIMSTIFSARLLLPFLVALSVLVFLGQAFVIPTSTTASHCSLQQRRNDEIATLFDQSPRDSVSLFAKKKRRRRKKSDNQSSPPPPPTASTEPEAAETAAASQAPKPVAEESNELPDFDLGEGAEDAAEAKEVVRASLSDPEAITPNMMASGYGGPSKSLDELLNDRSIEERFEFDERGDPSIPDFVDLAKSSSTIPTYSPDELSSAGLGKKKARQAERVAKAIAAREAAEPEESILVKYFPQFLNEKGDFSSVKLLENGGTFQASIDKEVSDRRSRSSFLWTVFYYRRLSTFFFIVAGQFFL